MTASASHATASLTRPPVLGLVREAPVADWVSIEQLYTDPFPAFERLRAEGGVHWVPAVGRYLITSYAAVHATELDQEVFSADEEGSLMKRAMGHPMLRKDDPEHHPERRAYMPTLKPATVKKVWTRIFHEQAERYLEEFRAKGPGADLVWDFAAPYTAETLRAVIGLHNVTGDDLQRWSQCLIDATGNYAEDPEVWARGRQASAEVDAAIDEMIPWHLAHPDHSLLSGLLSFPEYRMPIESIRSNLKMTIGGGLNEPRDALGVTAYALLSDPVQRGLAIEGERWHEAFDEGIRWVAPIGMYSRQTTRETVLAGVRLPAGARLGICLLSANRDEHEWTRPDRFDLARTGEGAHLAFGKGVHNCAGAWVARAQVADVALPLLFKELPGLRLDPADPAVLGGWVFRGMDRMPVLWDAPAAGNAAAASTTSAPAAGAGRHVVIVGAGPAGSFTAQALRRTLPGAEVTVFDARPAPFGLVRAGVAPDHQGTKAVAEQFTSMYESGGVRFIGCAKVRQGDPDEDVVLSGKPGVYGPAVRSQDAAGAEVTLDQLREAFDVVVLATGLDADRGLDVPGAGLDGVLGAGAVTRWLNGDPEQQAALAGTRLERAQPLGEAAAVVGMGNVALDVVRLLAKDAAGLEGSDVHDAAHAALTDGLRTVHVAGRSRPEACAFDPVMLREIAELDGVAHRVHGADPAALTAAARAGDPEAAGRAAAVLALVERAEGQVGRGAEDAARLTVEWWFGFAPERVLGDDGAVTGLVLTPTGAAVGHAASTTLDVGAVITAIGFADRPDPLLAQADVPAEARETGRFEEGLYLAGWARRGPRGTIPSQRADAKELAELIAADLAGTGGRPEAEGREAPAAAGSRRRALGGMAAVRPYLSRATDFDGWLRIDAAERAEAGLGRRRRKMTDARRQRLLAAGAWERPERAGAGGVAAAQEVGRPKPVLTVLFGTESGNAEVASEAIAAHLASRFAVTVRDLADTDPADLGEGTLAVAVCSTYGEGELPTSARGFAERLAEGARLDGVRFAAFSLGDRTYGETYSRGVDLLTAAFEAAGAEHVLETGRHDAATGRPTADAAREWAEAVAEGLAALAGEVA